MVEVGLTIIMFLCSIAVLALIWLMIYITWKEK